MKRITATVTAASAFGALALAAVSTGMLPASASTSTSASASARPAAQAAHQTAAHPVKRQITRKAKAAKAETIKKTEATKAANAAKAKAAKTAKANAARAAKAKAAKAKTDSPVQILSQYGNGQYVSTVQCQRGQVPPPLHIREPGVPLRLAGQQPSVAVTRSQGQYKPVYRCTLVIKEKPVLPGKGGGIGLCGHVKAGSHDTCNVTLNTGFGGAASSVKGHRPRG